MEEELASLSGRVESVVFHNETNGWSVVELDAEGEMVTVVGSFGAVRSGDDVRVLGGWVNHPSYGRQFKAQMVEHALPETAGAILKYLSSGAIRGVGAAMAKRIVEHFGAAALDAMEKEPERLTEIRGISRKKALEIGEQYRQQFGLRTCMMFLQQYGVTAAEAIRVWKRFGVSTSELVKKNPYILCSPGLWISFERADEIAEKMDYPLDSPRRLEAGVVHILRHNLYSGGHTYLPLGRLSSVACALLRAEPGAVEAVIEGLVAEKTLREDETGGCVGVFLDAAWQAESYIAGRLSLMLQFKPPLLGDCDARIGELEKSLGIEYAGRQREAIRAACRQGLMILTGGPGTGKTTTINAIIRIYAQMGLKVALCAPTGRAAKRMSEVCGMEAKTIHRLLEMEYSEDDVPRFSRNERNLLDCDAIIVDELSMVDVMLLESLLRAMKLGCRLVMVGDSNQLPPVGAGNALRDMIDSGKVPCVTLDEIFRQAAQSLIVLNAHSIVRGEMPDLSRRSGDFFFLPKYTAAQVSSCVRDLVETRLPAAYGYSPLWDIQVLAPGKKGELGTFSLNAMLQEALNPPGEGKAERKTAGRVFRVGDKVMQTRNNYDLAWKKDAGEQGAGVYNGDIGAVTAIDRRTGLMTIRFDDRVAEYPPEGLDELDLAYAVTVHKSQGSEFRAVVLPLFTGAPQLFYRNLLYTAVTRARELCILVGREATVRQMVENGRKSIRFTALADFLKNGGRTPSD